MEFEPIATERLVLRRLEMRDRARLITLANNWRVAKNLATMPFPYTEAAADFWLTKQAQLWAEARGFPLAITQGGELIGGIGVGPREGNDWELGYWLGEPNWNRGYASEAAAAILDHTFSRHGLDHVVAGHFPDNHASGRVLTKLGFRYTSECKRPCLAQGTEVRCLEMALSHSRWLQVRAGKREDLVA